MNNSSMSFIVLQSIIFSKWSVIYKLKKFNSRVIGKYIYSLLLEGGL